MTSGTPTMNSATTNGMPQLRPRTIVMAVLLSIAALLAMTTLRAAMPGYSASPQSHDDRPQTLPDR